MKNICVLSDFDGTITNKDGLYAFIEAYAKDGWQKIEQDWTEGKISSKECLIEEFKLIPNLSEELISHFIQTLGIDEYFKSFWEFTKEKNIDFYIISDGIDYFIDKILHKYGLDNLNIISNHGEFRDKSFELTFPNDNPGCVNNAGTCKCAVLKELKEKYEQIYYIGDGVSDFCVAGKADVLFAKSRLKKYCSKNSIKYIEYNNFNDILRYFGTKNDF